MAGLLESLGAPTTLTHSTCITCGLEKPWGDFPRRATAASGHAGECKRCHSVRRLANFRKTHPLLQPGEPGTSSRSQARRRAGVQRLCRDCSVPVRRPAWLCPECKAAVLLRHGSRGGFARRAAQYGVPYVFVNKVSVFARDGWVCGICTEPIDRELRWPAPRSASLDHVVPMFRGGAHSPENTQASHLRCNLSKGASLVQALAREGTTDGEPRSPGASGGAQGSRRGPVGEGV